MEWLIMWREKQYKSDPEPVIIDPMINRISPDLRMC